MKYDIIYADPPWQYSSHNSIQKVSLVSKDQSVYPTLSTKEICALDVAGIAEKDALCFLWSTSPMLPDAMQVMVAWGFKYATIAFVWDKQRINAGSYTMSQVEICLVAKRGKIPVPRGTRNERQFLSEMRAKHSAKPAEVRERIERMFPTQKKIELFARGTSEGWDVLGDGVGKGDIREVLRGAWR